MYSLFEKMLGGMGDFGEFNRKLKCFYIVKYRETLSIYLIDIRIMIKRI